MFHWLRRRTIKQTAWSAGAYLTADRIVIYSMSRTRNNVGWYNQPVFVIPKEASNDLLGKRLRDALNASTWDSLEDDSQDKKHPIVCGAGARTWRQLEKSSRHACIDSDKHVVKVLPSRWATKAEGGRGFLGLLENQIEVEWDGPDAEFGFGVATRL